VKARNDFGEYQNTPRSAGFAGFLVLMVQRRAHATSLRGVDRAARVNTQLVCVPSYDSHHHSFLLLIIKNLSFPLASARSYSLQRNAICGSALFIFSIALCSYCSFQQ
jgi:hypothetical protein